MNSATKTIAIVMFILLIVSIIANGWFAFQGYTLNAIITGVNIYVLVINLDVLRECFMGDNKR